MIDAVEYRFKIDGLHPDTLPMVRLADYLGDLARLLGSPDHVHFSRIEEGSAVLIPLVEQQARPIVSPRVRAVARGEGPKEALNAWSRINAKLSEDAASATLEMPGGEIIPFPGAPQPERPIGPIRQATSIQGRLVRLEGAGESVWVGIDEGAGITGRIAVRAVRAKELGAYFHRVIRLSGMGRWRRSKEGSWTLEHLDAEAFEVLDEGPLSDALRNAGGLMSQGEAAQAVEIIRDLRRA